MSVYIESEGGHTGEIGIYRLFLNSYIPGVEVKVQEAEELHWKHLVLCRPIHP